MIWYIWRAPFKCGYYALVFDTVDLSFNSFEGSSNFSTSARCLQKSLKFIFIWKQKITWKFSAYCKVWTEYPLRRPTEVIFKTKIEQIIWFEYLRMGWGEINLGCWLLQEVKPAFVSGGWQAGSRQSIGYTSQDRQKDKKRDKDKDFVKEKDKDRQAAGSL